MNEHFENDGFERDAVDKIIDICRTIEDPAVRQIVLGTYYLTDYERDLRDLEKKLRRDSLPREQMFNRIVNLAFLYIVAKYDNLHLQASTIGEARIQHAVEQLYSTYNVTDDVVRFIILNVALCLDASPAFSAKFDILSDNREFYTDTNEYINIFKHMQKLRQSTFKNKGVIDNSAEYLYLLLHKLEFVCKLKIVDDAAYADENSPICPCAFECGGAVYPTKYSLVRYKQNEYVTKFLFLRSVEDRTYRNHAALRLNYTELGEDDTSDDFKVFVAPEILDGNEIFVTTPSVGMFYAYVSGDLLRKRHRMSFCNGLTSYKYYGELATSVMDALEILTVAEDKQAAVVERYVLPVVKHNFNICKEDCVCTGVGCKYGAKTRLCNRDKAIVHEEKLNAECLTHMDIVSILTILFSVVGCKEILPQIFAQFKFDSPQAYDRLFAEVNAQLDKRFSEFDAKKVEALRRQFYKKSIDYLSLDLGEDGREDAVIAHTLKPFKIRAYTDALVASLENLDRDKTDYHVTPGENVYSIRSKIDLLNGIDGIEVSDVRGVLRDTLKIILAYYTGLANCTQQQLNYEIQAEQMSTLSDKTVRECYDAIGGAFMKGVDQKIEALGAAPDFYTLFHALESDTEDMRPEISLMLGRELINRGALHRYIELDETAKKCYLVEKQKRDGGGFETVYACDLDDERICAADPRKFVSRVAALLEFFRGDETRGARFACYPQVLIHTSSRVNVDNTTINAFTVYENEQYTPQKEYNVITYFGYEISKRYYYVAPKKFEKTRWITYPILIRCSEFYKHINKENVDG